MKPACNAQRGVGPPGTKRCLWQGGNPATDAKLRNQQAADPLAVNSSLLPFVQGGAAQ